jgi:DNA-binding transcriptional MerR regulator
MSATNLSVTLTILLLHEASCNLATHKILLALPTNANSVLDVQDLWKCLSQFGVDLEEIRNSIASQSEDASLTLAVRRVDGSEKLEALVDLERKQFLSIKEKHENLQALCKEADSLQRIVKNKWEEERSLDDKLQDIMSRISKLQQREDYDQWHMNAADGEMDREDIDLFTDTDD